MNREIKFRCWLRKHSENGPKMVYNFIPGAVWEINKNHPPIMQYTGLKEKNGKEIYEGDIIKYSWLDNLFEIKFGNYYTDDDNKGYGFYLYQLSDKESWPMNIDNDYIIVGNIYQNPELLETK